LKVNKTLRFLDLESNYLTQDTQDPSGVHEFIKVPFIVFKTFVVSVQEQNLVESEHGK